MEQILQRLSGIDMEKAELLLELENLQKQQELGNENAYKATNLFSSEQKISLFLSLFRGREDVFPKRWDNVKTGKSGYAPACHNEWVRGVCNKPQVKCSVCLNQYFIAVTPDVIRKHLVGDYTIGVYPMLKDETCWFIAADFDKENWQRDATAFLETCRQKNVPAIRSELLPNRREFRFIASEKGNATL